MKKIILLMILLFFNTICIFSFASEEANLILEAKQFTEDEKSQVMKIILKEFAFNGVILNKDKTKIIYKTKILILGEKYILSIDKEDDLGSHLKHVNADVYSFDEVLDELPVLIKKMMKNETVTNADENEVDENKNNNADELVPRKVKEKNPDKTGIMLIGGVVFYSLQGYTEYSGDKEGLAFMLTPAISFGRVRVDCELLFDSIEGDIHIIQESDDSNTNNDGSVWFISLKANYYFLDTDISPFAGLGISYGTISTEDYRNEGFYIPAVVGVELFRTKGFQVIGQLQSFIAVGTTHEIGKSTVPLFFSLAASWRFNSLEDDSSCGCDEIKDI